MSKRRIEYVFGPPRPSSGHSLGVSSLMLSQQHSLTPDSYATLFSGGRDGRINAWALSHDSPTVAAKVSDTHTNWVFAMLPYTPQHVVSCSADTTVKLWDLNTNSVSTIGNHTDYVQCLTKFGTDCVVSGGLDEKIIGWDVELRKPRFEISTDHSMYALATTKEGEIVGGSPDGAVRLWDPRENLERYTTKFMEHTDSVRRVFVSGDYIVSGSSDTTIRVFSRRMGRPVRVFSQLPHSIWSLVPLGSNGFVAGDRDGNIFRCDDFVNGEPRLEISHSIPEGGLKGICLDVETQNCWCSTPFSPDLRRLEPQQDQTGKEIEVLKGHDGLRKHRLLNDKCRALIADTRDNVSMVDLLSARPIDFHRKLPPGLSNEDLDDALDEILQEVNTMDVLDNWCQVQTRAGQICVTLDRRSINNTEIYLDELIEHVQKIQKTPVPSPVHSPLSTPTTSFLRRPNSSPAVSRVTSSKSLQEVLHRDALRQQKKLGTGQGQAKFYDPDEEEEEEEEDDTADDEIRINLGNYVLENLLRGVITRKREEFEKLPAKPEKPAPAPIQQSAPKPDEKLEKKRHRFFHKLLGKNKKKEEEPAPKQEVKKDSKPATHDANGKPLTAQQIKQNLQEKQQTETDSQTFDDAWARAKREHIFTSADPEAPTPNFLSPQARLIITEIVPGAGAPTEIFSTTVGTLINNSSEANSIEHALPGWVGDAVLLGKLKIKQPIRVGFSVMPADKTDPELSNESIRLMAIGMLRARKIMAFTVSQLQKSHILSEKASEYLPEELISLTCEGQEISALTTLATIRTRIWRNGGDVAMLYSIKKKV